MPDVTVIVPVYNERGVIEAVYRDLKKNLENQPFTSEILFVNDGSSDNPEEVFRKLEIPYVSHPQNRGYGATIKTGVKNATTPFVCIMDCDSTYAAKDIARLMAFRHEYPMVVGARDIKLNPKLYIFTKTFICGLLKLIFGKKVEDINSGLRVIRRDLFLHYEPILCDRFSLTSSITFGFLLDGHGIHYIPIEYNKRLTPSKIRRFSFFFTFLKGYWDVYEFHLKHRSAAAKKNKNSR